MFQALALRLSKWMNCALCACLHAENGAMLLVGIWQRVNKNKLVEWKVPIDTVGIESADLKEKSLF